MQLDTIEQHFKVVRRRSDKKVLRTIAIVLTRPGKNTEICVLEDFPYAENGKTVMRTMHLWHKMIDYMYVPDGTDGVQKIY